MKRFSETEKWNDPWFRALGVGSKLTYLFILDCCNCAGFWEIDVDSLAFHTKLPCDKLSPLFEGLNKSHEGLGKVLIRRGNFVWVKDFVSEQKNLPLNTLNNAHRKIIAEINRRAEFEEASLLLPQEEQITRARVSQKEAVWVRDGGKCLYCGKLIEVLADYELDHIVPRAAHVSEVYTNFATSCKNCNREKTDKRVSLTVADYSSAEAKRDLASNPGLLLRFNEFFVRELRVHNNSLTELAPHCAPNNGALSPIGIGIGIGKVEKGESAERGKQAESKHPSREEARSYGIEIKMDTEAVDGWFDHFEANGWRVGGKTPMRDWKAALRNGKRNAPMFTAKTSGNGSHPPKSKPIPASSDY